MDEGSPRPGRAWPGRLISFEGIDGAGKSTQVATLATWLAAEGREVVSVREPGETDLGRDVREIILHRTWEARLDPWAEALLLVAARAQLVSEIVIPALMRGAVVVCDRFVDSTLAYQGAARGLGMAPLRLLHAASCGDIWPDLTVYLELPVATALRRRHDSELPLDRMEAGGGAFLDAVARGFAEISVAEPRRVVRVDAARPPTAVATTIRALVAERLQVPA